MCYGLLEFPLCVTNNKVVRFRFLQQLFFLINLEEVLDLLCREQLVLSNLLHVA